METETLFILIQLVMMNLFINIKVISTPTIAIT